MDVPFVIQIKSLVLFNWMDVQNQTNRIANIKELIYNKHLKAVTLLGGKCFMCV